ncbi:MAG TPA: hypothetical protein VHP11_00925 [Tepidisphaeraceae bacterium]|nr:hypothetical protein [Tepidisphaeraceae bacterium]
MRNAGYKTLLLTALLIGHVCAPHAWPADAPDPSAVRAAESAVRQAVTRFADALIAADATQLRSSIWVSEGIKAQELGRDALIDLIVAEKRLERSAVARFGAEGQRFRCGFDLIFSAADRQALSNAVVVFDDPKSAARVVKPGEVWPLRVRQSPRQSWRVVLDILDNELDDDPNEASEPDDISNLRIERLRATAEAVNLTALRIEQGQTSSAITAESELLDRLATIAADFRANFRKLPDRYRWGADMR